MTLELIPTPTHESFLAAQSQATVVPLCIYAAGRKSFDVVVRGGLDSVDAKDAVFMALPLREHGWDKCATSFRTLKKTEYSRLVRVSRE